MEKNILSTKVRNYLRTDHAMETLQEELRRDREIRAEECPYCFAQPGDPCHTRSGELVRNSSYHILRLCARSAKNAPGQYPTYAEFRRAYLNEPKKN